MKLINHIIINGYRDGYRGSFPSPLQATEYSTEMRFCQNRWKCLKSI